MSASNPYILDFNIPDSQSQGPEQQTPYEPADREYDDNLYLNLQYPNTQYQPIRKIKSEHGGSFWKDRIHPDLDKYYGQAVQGRKKGEKAVSRTPEISRHEIEGYSAEGLDVNDFGSPQSECLGQGEHKGANRVQKNNNQVISTREAQQLRKEYEERISVLEHQNKNLKDELFYLRAAIMDKYEQRTKQTASFRKRL